MAGTAVDSIKKWLPRLADALFPRRCPFCGALLGADALQGTICPACVPEEMRLQHIPPRLPEGEHSFYALSQAAAAYYYADAVRSAILRCKRGGSPWRARELADRMAVLVFGALPARRVGGLPQYLGVAMLPLYNCIVPVPPCQPLPGMPGLPLLLALALAVSVVQAHFLSPLCPGFVPIISRIVSHFPGFYKYGPAALYGEKNLCYNKKYYYQKERIIP